MGWNTSAIFVCRECSELPALLDKLGVMRGAEARTEVDFFTASSSLEFEDVHVATIQDWTIIVGAPVMLADTAALAELSKQGMIVMMVLSGVASTYHYSMYQDGVELRSFTEQEGEITRSEGEPLSEEQDLHNLSMEARVLEITQRCTLKIATYEEANFVTYRGESLPAG